MSQLISVFAGIVITLLAFANSAMAQGDRGTLTGTVSDPGSALVPNAKISIRNSATGALFETVTTETGNYTVVGLPIGLYDLSVEAPGFGKRTQQGIRIQVAQTARIDVVLQLGSTAETVTVTADAPLLRTENAEVSMNLNGEKINQLPLNFGAGGTGSIRNWTAFRVLSPGVNGTSVNGLPGNLFKIMVEGIDLTSGNHTSWTSDVSASSVEAIGEFSLQTSNFSAQYAGGLGALYNFSTKSGTNQIHGTLYNYMTNETIFNAHRHFQASRRDRDRKIDAGGSVGGPLSIPKLYNGKDRTFYFVQFERFTNKTITFNQLGTVPTAAYREGDFSAALTGRRIGTDPLGNPVLENVIYDPRTDTNIDGRIYRQPFPNNVIPKSLLDPVALKIQALMPMPTSNELNNNWRYDLVNPRDQNLPSVKIDHNFSAQTKASFYWSYQSTHDIAGNDPFDYPITAKRDKTATGHTYRLNLDRTLTPTFLAHFGVGFLRFHNPDSSQAGSLTYDALGQLGLKGSATNPAGFPRLRDLSTGTSAVFGGLNSNNGDDLGPTNANDYFNDKLTFVLDLTYIKASHTLKFGGTFFNEMFSDRNTRGAQGDYTFSRDQTGNPALQGIALTSGTGVGLNYASFLLGGTSAAQVNAVQDPQWRKNNWGMYVEDSWKATRRLTLTFGLRYDYQPLGHEIHYRNSMFGPTIPNPNAGGKPGALVYEGFGPGRCDCNFTDTYAMAFGPRLSAAYQIDSKTVIRAGWGISYGPGPNWQYVTNRTLRGVGFDVFQMPQPAYAQPASYIRDGLVYDQSSLYVPSLDPGAGVLPSALTNNVGSYFDRNGGRPQRINQWNIAVQRELISNLSLEAAYVGNRGAWLEANNLAPLNALTPEILASRGLSLNNAADRQLLTLNLNNPQVIARGFGVPYAGYPTNRSLAQSLRPYPQFTDALTPTWAPLGSSWYDSLQVKLTKRYSHGLDLTTSFTWQKSLALGNGAGGSGGADGGQVNDFTNRANQKTLTGDYRPMLLVIGFTYQVPKFTNNRVIREVAGNWTFSGILNYRAGSLISVPTSVSSNMNNLLFQNTRFNRVGGQSLFTLDPGCHCIDPNRDTQLLNPAAWQDVPAGQWGVSAPSYSDYRWVSQADEQISVGRVFPIKERLNFSVRVEMFNAFNRVTLPAPSSTNPGQTPTYDSQGRQTGGFGFINTINGINGARTGQLVARIQF